MSQQKALTLSQVYRKDGIDLAAVNTKDVNLTAAGDNFQLGVSKIVGIQYYQAGDPKKVPVVVAAADRWYVKTVSNEAVAGAASAPRVVIQSDTVGAEGLTARILYVNQSVASDTSDLLYPL
jgi:hypothetical protein